MARRLLQRAVDDFKSQGFDAVIALPVESGNFPEKRYRGTLNMYRELGFEEIEKRGDLSVVRLAFDP